MNGQPQPTDSELLAGFAENGSQADFAVLVERYGNMVHGVCLRVLGDHHEAQDATQAVFLTLARKAGSLRRDPSVGGWLYTVARRLAKDWRNTRTRRQTRETDAMHEPTNPTEPSPEMESFREELDEAISQLPARYQWPLVLFHLQGCSLEQTSRQLGLNPKTASTRLVRAREMLRRKLVRRGVTVGSVGALTALLSTESGAAVLPATIVSATAKAAGLAAAGKLAVGVSAGTVSANVAALTKGALNMLFWNSVKTVVLTAACAGVVGTSVVVAQRAVSDSSPAPATKPMPKEVYTEIGRFVEVTPEGRPVVEIEIHSLERRSGVRMESGEMVERTEPATNRVVAVTFDPAEGERDALKASAAKYKAGDMVKVFWGRDTQGRHFALRVAGATDPMPAEWGAIEKSGYGGPGRDPYLTKSGASPLAATGDPGKVFKPVDQSQPGFYADGKWSYALEIKGDQRQGNLKYDAKNVGDPQPGDYLLTPWGWMQWQEQGHWLPVAEKPAKGKQLPDPAK